MNKHVKIISMGVLGALALGYTADTALTASPEQTIINYGGTAKTTQIEYAANPTVAGFKRMRWAVGRFRSSRWANKPLPYGSCTGVIKVGKKSTARCKFRNKKSKSTIIVWSTTNYRPNGSVGRFYVTFAISSQTSPN